MARSPHNPDPGSRRWPQCLCVVALTVAVGCQTTSSSHQNLRPAMMISHAAPQPAEAELRDVPVVMQPTVEEVAHVFRDLGGKLRPNESGEIVEIDLSFSTVTDSQLNLIGWFPELVELDLTGTDIHDESLNAIGQLQSLHAVKLKGTRITSQGLQSLSGLSSLMLLDASNTAIADDGLMNAASWHSLRYLSLNDTQISDIGLLQLATLRQLRGLSLINTSVSENGVNELKRRLPDCVIVARSVAEKSQPDFGDGFPVVPDLGPLGSETNGLAPSRQLAQLIDLAGKQPHLAVHLSKVYSTRGQWEETTQILATANVVDPSNQAVSLALGEAYARIGRPEDAQLHLEQILGSSQAKYVVGMIIYEDTLRSCERYFGEVAEANPSLQAAQTRQEKIRKELASLRSRQATHSESRPYVKEAEPSLEIVPAPKIHTASQSRTQSSKFTISE